MVYIITGKNYFCGQKQASNVNKKFNMPVQTTRGTFGMDPEQVLEQKLEAGTVTDWDCYDIQTRGSEKLKLKMDRIHNDKYRIKKDLDRKYGKGVFDGVDNDGNPYKDTKADFETLKTNK